MHTTLRRLGTFLTSTALGLALAIAGKLEAQTIQTNIAATVLHAPSLNGGLVEGSIWQLMGESVTLNGGFTLAGDLLAPGTPTVQLNGTPSFAGTIVGSGSASPSGYRITLNGGCVLNNVRTRINPITLPTVAAPPQPSGTRSVTINTAGQSYGDSSTLRNLTLNGNVGQVSVPPGTYGNLMANAGSGFIIGVAGATQPAIYNLQNLTLNGQTRIDIIGPVILTVANGFTANGLLGTTNQPTWLQLQIANGGFTLNGGCTVNGIVTVPSGTVIINGSSYLFGSVACDRLIINGGGHLKWAGAGATANQHPVANAQNLSVPEDTALSVTLTGSDPENSSLVYTVLSQPAHGTLSGTPPNLTYSPATNFNGSDSFTFKVNDGQADSGAATVAITVTPVNDAPTALSQNLGTPEDTQLAITLSGSDVENDPLTFQIVTSPAHGSLSGTAPNLIYLPATNYNGSDSFTYRANDGHTVSASATVSISIQPVEDAPVANAQSVTTDEDTPLSITLSGGDVDGESLFFEAVTQPQHGTLSGTAPNLIYTPGTNFNGTDSFTFEVSDSILDSDPATVSVVVRPVNDVPIADTQVITTPEDTATNLTLTASDVDGDSLSYAVVTTPANGTLSGTPPHLVFSPQANFNGTNTFTFTASDGNSTSAPVTVTLIVTPVNDAPIAIAQALTLDEDIPAAITLSATDVENDSLSFTILNGPTNGTLSGTAPHLTYTPTSNFNGLDAFTFEANDGQTNSLPASVILTVRPVNDAPVASGQSVTTDEDTPATIVLTATDVDGDALTYSISSQPAHGTLSLLSGNQFTYTPNLNYNGADSFSFVANDGTTNSSAATVSITVNPVNDPPVAQNLTVTSANGQPVSGTVTATDPDGDSLTFALQTQGSKGTAVMQANGNFVYTPQAGASGVDTFAFTTSDGSASAIGTVTVHLSTSINHAPVARSLSVTNDEDTPVTITLSATDADNDPLTFQVTDGPYQGTFENSVYTPGTNFNGQDSFTFVANDGTVDSSPATVTITVRPINDAPELSVPGTQTLERGKTIPFDFRLPISINDPDAGDGTVQFSVSATNGTLVFNYTDGLTWVSDPNNPTNPIVTGTLGSINSALNGWGNLSYVASSNFSGDVITLTIDDLGNTGAGGHKMDTKTIRLLAANVAPFVAITDPALQSQFAVGQAIPITVTASDVDGQLVSVKLYANDTQLMEWSGPPYTFVLTNTTLGDYVLHAIATDNQGSSTISSNVTVSVVEAGSGDFSVDAGSDQNIEIAQPASLNGQLSIQTAIPGGETNVTWSKLSGPGNVDFSNANSLATAATFAEPGSYTLILRVEYGGGTHSDTINVNVLAMPPQQLVAARSTKGTDFWMPYLFQYASSDYGIFNRVMIAADVDTEVTVVNGGFAWGDSWRVETNYVHVAAGIVGIVPINSPTGYGFDPVDNTIIADFVHVSASAPVTVHGFTRDSYTADGYLALPTAMLSTNYMVMAYTGASDFGVLATEDNTSVTITPTADIFGRPAAQPWTFVLRQGQSYRVTSPDGDFTGTKVTSDKPIAVVGGAVGPDIPQGFCCSDDIIEEMTPISLWGRHFVSMPLATRSGGDTFRFLASEDHTVVSVNGNVVATLNQGQFHEQLIQGPAVILGSKPILVAQFANSQEFDQTTGDPFMSLVPPVEEFGGNYLLDALTLAGTRHYWEEPGWTYYGGYDPSNPGVEYSSYLNLIVYGNGTNSISLDGNLLPPDSFQAIGNSGYFGTELAVSNTAHRITGTVPIGGLVYGWAPYESYAFLGGIYTESLEADTHLTLTQATAYSPIGGTKSVSVHVTNGRGLPVADINLPIRVTGANATIGRALTSRTGDAVFSYTGTNGGVDVITAGVADIVQSVTNTWITTDDNFPPVVLTTSTAPVQTGLVLHLGGLVFDDGRPTGGGLNIQWKLLDGPGSVEFDNANQADTTVTCSAPGLYRFELTADDSQFSSKSDVSVAADLSPVIQFPWQGIPSVVTPGTTLTLAATANDPDGSIDRVEFYANGELVGTSRDNPDYWTGYAVSWTPPGIGTYQLQAVAYDSFGTSTPSDVFTLEVSSPPTVAIDNIANGALVIVPTNVLVHASASDSDGSIASLSIYLNGNLVDTSTNGDLTISWVPRIAGDYSFNAVATDNLGLSTTSDSITVTVGGVFPQIAITNPVADGFAFSTPTGKRITLMADASIPAPYQITNVSFYLYGELIGSFTNPPYNLDWTPTGGNIYDLITVEADADSGAVGQFSMYIYAFLDASISIATPTDGQSVFVGQPVPIQLAVNDPWNTLQGFNYYINGQFLVQTNSQTVFTPQAPGNYGLYVEGVPFQLRAYGSVNAYYAIPPESVGISSPTDGTSVYPGGQTPITVTFDNSNAAFDHAEFFANGVSIGQSTNGTLAWTAVGTNDYVLTAQVYDRYGQTYNATNSITLHVVPPPAPQLVITEPVAGSTVRANADDLVVVKLTDPAGLATNLEFYVDGVMLTNAFTTYFTWTPTLLGNHTLQVVAAGSDGSRISSAVVGVTAAVLYPPTVAIISPANDARFASNSQPVLLAEALDSDGAITNLTLTLDDVEIAETNGPVLQLTATNIGGGLHTLLAQAVDNSGLGGISDTVNFFVERSENPSLPVPNQLTATALSANEILLTWQPIATNDLTSAFIVERWDASNSLWVEIVDESLDNTNYTDPGLTPGTFYRYRVAVLDTNGNRSAYSTEASATTRTVVPNYTVLDLTTAVIASLSNRPPAANILTNTGLNNFDSRRTTPTGLAHLNAVLGTNAPAFKRAVAHFKDQWPQIQLDYDPVLLSPKSILPRTGYLTGPGGAGVTVSNTTALQFDANDPYLAVKTFLQDHQDLFGFGVEGVTNASVLRDYVSAGNSARTVVWQQQVAGVPVFDAMLIGHITSTGELAGLSSEFIPAPVQAADPAMIALVQSGSDLPLSSPLAVLTAITNAGNILGIADLTPQGTMQGMTRKQTFTAPQGLKGQGYAELTWFPSSRTKLELTWQVLFTSQWDGQMFITLVSAETGEILLRRSLTSDSSDATYRIYTSSPAPMSPGLSSPASTQAPLVDRVLTTLTALDPTASPNGWINDGDNETRGNNVDAHLDRDDDNAADVPRPTGNPSRVFDFPLDPAGSPGNYSAASTVQLFYWDNWMHDALYRFGFTEAAGNFQNDNFGRGGTGGDAVQADAQDGAALNDVAHRNNANMSTPPEGYPPRMQMYVFDGPQPNRDGSLDPQIVLHEYTHGLSSRLIGGGVGIEALQSAGMGEGWSDFYALSLLTDPTADANAVYPIGAYATYHGFGTTFDQNYYYGIRHYPYCTDTNKNPLTFADIDPQTANPHAGVPRSPLFGSFSAADASEVHGQGEVWCSMLWEVRANLIQKYGATQGNSLTLQLVTDGLKLSPPNPNFVQARDAILLADRMWSGGVNAPEIWAAFTKRGLGYNAKCPESYTTSGVQESYAQAPALVTESVQIQGGNGDGIVQANEDNQLLIVIHNQGNAASTQVSGQITTTTPGATIVQASSAYPDVPQGESRANTVLLDLQTSADFVEGTPIDLTFTVTSGQATTSQLLRVHTGTPGTDIPFNDPSSLAAPLTSTPGVRELTPIDLGNLEPLWMAENGTCLLKASTGKYVLWQPAGGPVLLENPKFLAHRLTRQGVVVGTVEQDPTQDEFGNYLRHTTGASWLPGSGLTQLTLDRYRSPADYNPSFYGLAYALNTPSGVPQLLGQVTNYPPTLNNVWDLNSSGTAVGAASVLQPFGPERHEFTITGQLNWEQESERGITAGYNGDATMRVDHFVQLSSAAQFSNNGNQWRWLGPLDSVTTASHALLINDAGMIAGYAGVTTGDSGLDALTPTHAFRAPGSGEYAGSGTILYDLGTLSGGLHSFPSAMNQAGKLAGYSDFGGGNNPYNYHAVFWDLTNTAPEDLGSLQPVPGAAQGYSEAFDINTNEQIVGTSLRIDNDGFTTISAGVLWQRNHDDTNTPPAWEVNDLNNKVADDNWRVLNAVGINGDGWILAKALGRVNDSNGNFVRWDPKSVLLVPAEFTVTPNDPYAPDASGVTETDLTYQVSADDSQVWLQANIFLRGEDPDNPGQFIYLPADDGTVVEWENLDGGAAGGALAESETTTADGFAAVSFTTSHNPGDLYKVRAKLKKLIWKGRTYEVPGTPLMKVETGAIEVVPGRASQITAAVTGAASAGSVPADGISEQLITATVKDASGNPVAAGTEVYWHLKGLGRLGAQEEVDDNGQVQARVVAGSLPGTQEVSIEVDGVTHTETLQNTKVDFDLNSSVGSVDMIHPENVTLTAQFPDAADGAQVTWFSSKGQILNPTTVQGGQATATLQPGTLARNGNSLVMASLGGTTRLLEVPFGSSAPVAVQVKNPVIAGNAQPGETVSVPALSGPDNTVICPTNSEITILAPSHAGELATVSIGRLEPSQAVTFEMNSETNDVTFDASGTYGASVNGAQLTTNSLSASGYLFGGQASLSITNDSAFEISSNTHIAVWINPSATGGTLLNKSGDYDLSLDDQSQPVFRIATTAGIETLTLSNTIPLNEWTRVDVKVRNRSVSLFVNGQTTSTNLVGDFLPNGSQPLLVGSGFTGTMDDLQIEQGSVFVSSTAYTVDGLDNSGQVTLDSQGQAVVNLSSSGQMDTDAPDGEQVSVRVNVGDEVQVDKVVAVVPKTEYAAIVAMGGGIVVSTGTITRPLTDDEREELASKQFADAMNTLQKSGAVLPSLGNSVAANGDMGFHAAIWMEQTTDASGKISQVMKSSIAGLDDQSENLILQHFADLLQQAASKKQDVSFTDYLNQHGANLIDGLYQLSVQDAQSFQKMNEAMDSEEIVLTADELAQIYGPNMIKDVGQIASQDNLPPTFTQRLMTFLDKYAPKNPVKQWEEKQFNGMEDWLRKHVNDAAAQGKMSPENAYRIGNVWGVIKMAHDLGNLGDPIESLKLSAMLMGTVIDALRGDKQAAETLAEMLPLYGTYQQFNHTFDKWEAGNYFDSGVDGLQTAIGAVGDATLVGGVVLKAVRSASLATKLERVAVPIAEHPPRIPPRIEPPPLPLPEAELPKNFRNIVGQKAETLVKKILEKTGKYTDLMSLQNASGNGIDLIGLDRRGNVAVFEIKGHRLIAKPVLSSAQKDLAAWAEKRLNQIANREGAFTAATEEQVASAKKFLKALNNDGKALHPIVINVDNALSEFPDVSVWRWKKVGKRPVLTHWPPTPP